VDHPVLAGALPRPDGDGAVATGVLSVTRQPWLADHRVRGRVVVPGTVLVDAVIRVGDEIGASHLDELVIAAPLLLPDAGDGTGATGAVAVQGSAHATDIPGRYTATIHSRPSDTLDAPWTLHATATLADRPPTCEPDASEDTDWSPSAEPVDVNDVYGALSAAGLEYGPAFRGLCAVRRDGDTLYADVHLPDRLH
jgi:acyl transferase domain-containing protein